MKHIQTSIGICTEKYLIYVDGMELSGMWKEYNSLEEAEKSLPEKSEGRKFTIVQFKSNSLVFSYV